MGSEPDLTIQQKPVTNLISRDGSFASVASSSTMYHTAKDDINNSSSLYLTPAGSGDLKPEFFLTRPEIRRDSNATTTNSNSATLEGAESLQSSSSDLYDDGMGSADNMAAREMSSSPSSENAMEVREDISRICNTIAEAEDFDRVKMTKIEQALTLGDIEKLGQLATSRAGLLSNALRTKAWPILLKVSSTDISKNEYKKIPTFYPDVPQKINNLVNLDVARVLKRFPPGLTDPQQDHLQLYLSNLICSVLQGSRSEKRRAYYYQGFHDISLTFLLVSISQNVPFLAYLCLNKMIESNLSPYMEKTMDKTHDIIHVLFAVIEAEDRTLFEKIVVGCHLPPAFCLPWVLTWFSHTLPSDTDVFRLYDFILGSQDQLSQPYLIPIFVSSMLVLRSSKSIMEDDSLNDIASMHHRLSKLPSELDSLEPWLIDSVKLMKKYKGQENKLLKRGVEIKAMQNRLWNEDNHNRPKHRPHSTNNGVIASVSKFLFVQHRWATLSLVILGTAFLLQNKYGRSAYKFGTLKSIVQGYAPERFKNMLKYWSADESSDE